jgi:hypothetical protein
MKNIGYKAVEEWCCVEGDIYSNCVFDVDGLSRDDCCHAMEHPEIEKREDCEYWRRDG